MKPSGEDFSNISAMEKEVVDDIMAKAHAKTDVGATPPNPDPIVLDRVRRIVERAGYNFDDYSG